MLTINLLNWREKNRKQKIKEFLIAGVLTILVSALLMIGIHVWFQSKINRQKIRNQWIEKEITMYNGKIKEIDQLKRLKDAFVARINVIYRLQADRFLIVKFFDQIVKILPSGIYLNKIARDETKITLDGVTESNASVSQFMRSVEHIKWLKNPKLNVIKKKNEKGHGFSEFNLVMWLSDEKNKELNKINTQDEE